MSESKKHIGIVETNKPTKTKGLWRFDTFPLDGDLPGYIALYLMVEKGMHLRPIDWTSGYVHWLGSAFGWVGTINTFSMDDFVRHSWVIVPDEK